MERRHTSAVRLNSRGSCHQDEEDLLLLQDGEGEDGESSLAEPNRSGGGVDATSTAVSRSSLAARRLKETIDADHHWEAHSAENNSVVMKTFQVRIEIGSRVCSNTSSNYDLHFFTFSPTFFSPSRANSRTL